MPQQYPPPPTEVIVTRPPRLKERTDSEEAKRKEREARSIAIEKAYVHDVYEQVIKMMVFVFVFVEKAYEHDVYEQVILI